MALAMSLLSECERNPNKWTSRDAALFLVSSLSVKGQTSAFGASILNPKIDMNSFLLYHVIPLIRASGTPMPNDVGADILRADSLRIIVLFRNHVRVCHTHNHTHNQLPNDILYSIVPDLARLLNGGYVVSTYAAHALEKLMTVKDMQAPNHPYVTYRERCCL